MSYCLSTSNFLNEFFPIPTVTETLPEGVKFQKGKKVLPKGAKACKPKGINFTDVKGFTSERDLAERWAGIVNEAKALCGGLVVCLSQGNWDPADSNKLKVDAAIYPRRKHPRDGRPHWGRQRALIEFKRGGTENDPYQDFDGDAQAKKPTEVRGQLASYSAYSFARQQRTANFLFLIIGETARITRWERGGTIFTEAFNYVEDPDLMCEFLWRFSLLSKEDQGLDPTAKILTRKCNQFKLMDLIAQGPLDGEPEDICADEGTTVPLPVASSVGVFKYVREKFSASLGDDAPRYRFSVPTDRGGNKYYLVGKPVFEASGMVGRGTRGYIAVDVHTKRFVWLKDVWRAYYVNVDPEGEILSKLHKANVSRIPTLLYAGDLQQETQMHRHWKQDSEVQDSGETSGGSRGSKRDCSGASKSTDKNQHKQPRIRRLSHYRLIVKEVGLRLEEIKSSRKHIQVVSDCVEAHEDAVTKAKIIHGDVSMGNVLILPTLVQKDEQLVVEWRGILADWELSKSIPKDGQVPRARLPDRTGTWQFMSAALLYWLRLPIAVEDELESFFHIILYAGVRFLWSTVPDVTSFLRTLFDAFQLEQDQYRCGAKKLDSMQGGFLYSGGGKLQFLRGGKNEHPLNAITADMLPLFQARYAVLDYKQKRVQWLQAQMLKSSKPVVLPEPLAQSVVDSAARLKTHAHFKVLLRRMLDEGDWPTDDYVGDLRATQVVAAVKDNQNTPANEGYDNTSSDHEESSPSIKRMKLEADVDLAIFGGTW